MRYLLLILLSGLCALHAADYTWNGAGDGSTWDSAANWGGSGYPASASDTATFDGSDGNSVTVPTGRSLGALTLASGYTGTVTLGGSLTISGNLSVKDGTLASDNNDFTVAGDIDLSGGTLSAGDSTLTLSGSTTQNITSSSTSFGNLVITNANGINFLDDLSCINLTCSTADAVLTFKESSSNSISGTLVLDGGGSGNEVVIDSALNGTRFTLNIIAGAQDVGWVSVGDCDVIGNDITSVNGTDHDGNTDAGEGSPQWVFAPTMKTWYWTGNGADADVDTYGDWDDEANWALDGDGSPGNDGFPSNAYDNVIFNSTAGTQKKTKTLANMTLGRISMEAGFEAGGLRQGGPLRIATVGGQSGGFAITAGSMSTDPSNSFSLDIEGSFFSTAGTFYANNSTITVEGSFTFYSTSNYIGGGSDVLRLTGDGNFRSTDVITALECAFPGKTTSMTGTVYTSTQVHFKGGIFNRISSGDQFQIRCVSAAPVLQIDTGTVFTNMALYFLFSNPSVDGSIDAVLPAYNDYPPLVFVQEGWNDTSTVSFAGDSTVQRLIIRSTSGTSRNSQSMLNADGITLTTDSLTIGQSGADERCRFELGSGNLIVAGDITIYGGDSSAVNELILGSGNLTLGGDIISPDSPIDAGTSTITMTASDDGQCTLDISNNSVYNLVLNTSSADDTFFLSDELTITNDFTLVQGHVRCGRDLIGHWRFDDGSGGTANDETGLFNGALNGGTWSADVPTTSFSNGGSLDLVNATDYVQIGHVDRLDGATQLSITAWLKVTDDANDGAIVSRYNDTGNRSLLLMRDNVGSYTTFTDSAKALVRNDGGTVAQSEGNQNVLTNDGAWHHVSMTFLAGNSTGLRLYVDGVLNQSAVSTTNVSALATESTPLQFGRVFGSTALALKGIIDDIRIYDRTLTASEISSLAAGDELPSFALPLHISGDLVMSGGSIQSTGSVSCAGAVSVSGGQFSNLLTLDLNGTTPQNVGLNGATAAHLLVSNANGVTFTDAFTVDTFTCQTAKATLNFTQGNTYTVNDTLTLDGGDVGNEIALDSVNGSTRFTLNVGSAQSVAHVTVANSEVTGADITASSSIDLGNTDAGEGTPEWVIPVDNTRYHWIGASSGNWEDQSNWRLEPTDGSDGNDGYPDDAADAAIFPSGFSGVVITTSTTPLTIGRLLLNTGFDGTVELGASMTASNASGRSGTVSINDGILTHRDNGTTHVYSLTLTIEGDLIVASDGAIDVNDRGFNQLSGPGTPGVTDYGGGHGGRGGSMGAPVGSTVYGDIFNPTTLGSGAGAGSAPDDGGGAVILTVAGLCQIDGSISADGTTGGAGGSVNISTARISGTGSISAEGGGDYNYCGGGGGRIALKLTGSSADFTNWSGTVSAAGGNSTAGTRDGAAGTVYLETTAETGGNGTLILDNGSSSSTNPVNGVVTPLINDGSTATFTVPTIIIRNFAHLWIESDDTVATTIVEADQGEARLSVDGTLTSPDIHSSVGGTLVFYTSTPMTLSTNITLDGSLRHPDNSTAETWKLLLDLTGNLTVNAGGSIDVSDLGYDQTFGPGTSGINDYGASHGGRGGSQGANAPANTYGDPLNPTTIGSGAGGGAAPDDGGGAAIISVSGLTTVNGTITAGGTKGGSGGSVNLTTGTLTGAGTIDANGGGDGIYTYPGGGGGRVAVKLTGGGADFTAWSGSITAYGGNSANSLRDGAAGTVYLETAAETGGAGELIIDNNNLSARTDFLVYTALADNATLAASIGRISVRNAGYFIIGSDDSLTTTGTGTTLNIDNTATLTLVGSLYLGGTTFTNAGTFTAQATSLVEYRGQADDSPVTILPVTYSRLNVNNTGTIFSPSASLSIDDDLSILNGTLSLNGNNLTVSAADTTFSNDDTLRLQGNESVSNLSNDTDSGTWEYVGNADATADDFSLVAVDYYHLTINCTDAADRILSTTSNSLLENLLAYYPFETGSGLTAFDAVASANGTITNADADEWSTDRPAPISAWSTHSLNLDGNNDWVNIPDSLASSLTGSFTWAAWIKSPYSGQQTILAANDSAGGNHFMWFVPNYMSLYCASAFHTDSSIDLTDGVTWHHVAVTLNNATGQVRYYVDGSVLAYNFTTSDRISATDKMSIGQEYDAAATSDYWNGFIDDVRIYNSVLDATTINKLASGTQDDSVTLASVSISGDLTVSAGTLLPPTNTTVAGNWTVSGGSVDTTGCTVTLNGSAQQQVSSGGESFETLVITNANGIIFADALSATNLTCTSASADLTFLASSSNSISGSLILDGGGIGTEIDLLSSTGSSSAFFTLNSSQSVDYVRVTDIEVTNGSDYDIVATNSFDVRSDSGDSSATAQWVFIPLSADYVWTGATDNDWTDRTNWRLEPSDGTDGNDGYPDSNQDTATFNATDVSDVSIPAGLSLGALTLDSGYSGRLTLSDDLVIDNSAGKSGALSIVTGGLIDSGHTINVDGDVSLTDGITYTATGSLSLTGTAQTLTSNAVSINNLIVNDGGLGGTVTLADSLHLTGSLDLIDGSIDASGIPHMVGYWPLDQGSGLFAMDLVGANDATRGDANGANGDGDTPPAWSSSKPSLAFTNQQALDHDGSDDYAATGTANLGITTSITLSAWVYVRSGTQVSHNTFFGYNDRQNVDSDNDIRFVWDNDDNRRGLLLRSSGAIGDAWAAGDISTDQWLHLAATWDGSTVRYYENGSELANAANSTGFDETDALVCIGMTNPVRGGASDSIIDDARIFSIALSPTQISRLAAGHDITAIDIDGHFVQSGGSFSAPQILRIAGNYTRSAGTFTHNSGQVIFDGNSVQSIDSANVSFNAVTITNTGSRVDITNTDCDISSELTLSSGELRITGSTTLSVTGGVSVADDATLSGDGSLSAAVALSDNAIFAPGDGAGGDLATGHLSFQANSVWDFELDDDADANNDKIIVGGDFSADGILNISDLGNFGPGTYTLLTYSGSLSADNGIALGSCPAGYNYSISTASNAVTLTVSEPSTLQSAVWTDLDGNGVDAGDSIALTFNNSVSTSSYSAASLGLPVSGDSLSGTIANVSNNTITLTLSGTPSLSPGGSYNSSNTTAGYASGIFIDSSTNIVDSYGFAVITGNAASAVDIAPATSTLAIQWADSALTTKTWALGLTFVSSIHNTVDDSVDLAIRNTGDVLTDLDIRITGAPAAWSSGASVGLNTYLLKVDNAGLPAADQTDAANYEVTLSTSDQSLFTDIYSGQSVDWEALFQLPSSVSGAPGSSSLTITITASAAVP